MKWPQLEWALPHNQKQNRNINSLQMQFGLTYCVRLQMWDVFLQYFASHSEREQDCKFHCWARRVHRVFFCCLGVESHPQSSLGSNLVKKSTIPSVISEEMLETQHFTGHFHVLMFGSCVSFFLCLCAWISPPLRSMKSFRKSRLSVVVLLCSWDHCLWAIATVSAFSISWTFRKSMCEYYSKCIKLLPGT